MDQHPLHLILQQLLNEGGILFLPLISLFHLGKLQTSRWMFRSVGPQCSAVQCSPAKHLIDYTIHKHLLDQTVQPSYHQAA